MGVGAGLGRGAPAGTEVAAGIPSLNPGGNTYCVNASRPREDDNMSVLPVTSAV